MSQNFSNMSDIYIPELIELDSYWQKAVEDAIYDTLKGEKRLYYALKNRKKINKKLEKLGLKPMHSQISFSGRCHFNRASGELVANSLKGKSESIGLWDSCGDNSVTSIGSGAEEDDGFIVGIPDGVPGSFPRVRSRSRSKNMRSKSPPNKKNNNPERPLLGDGSLEKMKKSQNSFNCEPMGAAEDDVRMMSESEDDDIEEMLEDPEGGFNTNVEEEVNKKIKWLHKRGDNIFDDSDTEVSSNEANKEVIEKNGFQKHLTLKDLNYFIKKKFNFGTTIKNEKIVEDEKKPNDQTIPMAWGPQDDLFWENEVKNAIRENTGLERKLYLALAKREILNKNLQGLRMLDSSSKIQIEESHAKSKKRNSQKLLSPFIKFYLEIYRELCHKCPVKQIAAEAAKRWETLTMKERLFYGSKSSKK